VAIVRYGNHVIAAVRKMHFYKMLRTGGGSSCRAAAGRLSRRASSQARPRAAAVQAGMPPHLPMAAPPLPPPRLQRTAALEAYPISTRPMEGEISWWASKIAVCSMDPQTLDPISCEHYDPRTWKECLWNKGFEGTGGLAGRAWAIDVGRGECGKGTRRGGAAPAAGLQSAQDRPPAAPHSPACPGVLCVLPLPAGVEDPRLIVWPGKGLFMMFGSKPWPKDPNGIQPEQTACDGPWAFQQVRGGCVAKLGPVLHCRQGGVAHAAGLAPLPACCSSAWRCAAMRRHPHRWPCPAARHLQFFVQLRSYGEQPDPEDPWAKGVIRLQYLVETPKASDDLIKASVSCNPGGPPHPLSWASPPSAWLHCPPAFLAHRQGNGQPVSQECDLGPGLQQKFLPRNTEFKLTSACSTPPPPSVRLTCPTPALHAAGEELEPLHLQGGAVLQSNL
jgi:hypothetical protein